MCLDERYKGYIGRFLPRKSWGGFIGSKIEKNLAHISDRAWIEIVTNKNLHEEEHESWFPNEDNQITVSSITQFAGSLGRMAERYPEQFGRLALRFPKDIHHDYVSAILAAIAKTKPGQGVPKDDAERWEQASVATVIAVWERFCDMSEIEVLKAFCRLVSARASEEWPENAIDRLVLLASEHSDPRPGCLVVDCNTSVDEATTDTLFQNTINCVRGVAAEAIGHLLWRHKELLVKLEPGIIALISHPHAVVRMSALSVIIPAFNIVPSQAVEWFCIASQADPRIPASRFGIEFFNRAFRQYPEQLSPLIRKMVVSDYQDVAQQGAQAIIAFHLFYGLFEDDLKTVISGKVAHRSGVARVAAHNITDERYADRCRELLVPLFNDSDKDVRDIATSVFRDEDFDLSDNNAVITQYIDSKAFTDDPLVVLRNLSKYKCTLTPFSLVISGIVKILTLDILNYAGNIILSQWEVTRILPSLLLRLYEQSVESEPNIANQCLDRECPIHS